MRPVRQRESCILLENGPGQSLVAMVLQRLSLAVHDFILQAKMRLRPVCANLSLVPRPLPDFISQPWRKIRRRPGTNATSRTGNGGLEKQMARLHVGMYKLSKPFPGSEPH